MLNSEFPVMWSTLTKIYPILNLSAAALLPLQREAGFAQHPPSGPSVNLQPNITIQTANNTSSSENVVSINCDGGRFGGNLNVRSCRTIFNWVSMDEQQITFSQRHSGIPGDLGLPWRVYSNDTTCFIQPVLISGATSGHASQKQIGLAALALYQHCVVRGGVGGVAADIGGDNNLLVVMASYKPNIRCDRSQSPGPPFQSCVNIWSDMDTSQERRIFGHVTDSGVQQELPFDYLAGDARCIANIDIVGRPTMVAWYEIWEAILAIASLCVRGKGKGGKATGLGLSRNIFVEMADENPDMQPPAANISLSNSSFLDTVSAPGAQDSSLESWPNEPYEVSTSLIQSDSSLVTLLGDTSTNVSKSATS
ncbi:hypothetical protein ABVK25_003990 [Lepraria finkii]|uniref:Uncharacterized protein n=1 Tax=Lepraria finkii TaxID=1340010 RepID=A0ABR4BFF7_9LECA